MDTPVTVAHNYSSTNTLQVCTRVCPIVFSVSDYFHISTLAHV
nr:MAG TPA: hypothetical protein [Caudoviricetes sp.]